MWILDMGNIFANVILIIKQDNHKEMNINPSKKLETSSNLMMVITQEKWQELNDRLDHLSSLVTNKNKSESNSEWLETSAVCKILGVSPKTFLRYRDKRLISYTQIGKKIWIKRSDLNSFMDMYYVPATV